MHIFVGVQLIRREAENLLQGADRHRPGDGKDSGDHELEIASPKSSWPGLSRPSTSGRVREEAWMPGPSPRRSGFGRAGGSSPSMTEDRDSRCNNAL
jgi:hypothetical protein